MELHDAADPAQPSFPLHANMYVHDFEELRHIPVPFVTNLRGIVHGILSTGTTQSGEGMMTVKIQDQRGNLLKSTAMGRATRTRQLLYRDMK